MAELADATDLGSVGQPCKFKSCYPYQTDSPSNFSFKRAFGLTGNHAGQEAYDPLPGIDDYQPQENL